MLYNRLHMKLILAQGNPGPEYASSRHNVGFMALDFICEQRKLPAFQQKTKFQAYISEFSHEGEKVILAKPTTYYNLTGQAGRAIADFYRITPENILVIHDELALDFGTIRVRSTGSDAGNKGIRSLLTHIGSDFWRIRVGIHNELAKQMDSADFVLSQFSADEKKALMADILPGVDRLAAQFLDSSLEPTSTRT